MNCSREFRNRTWKHLLGKSQVSQLASTLSEVCTLEVKPAQPMWREYSLVPRKDGFTPTSKSHTKVHKCGLYCGSV